MKNYMQTTTRFAATGAVTLAFLLAPLGLDHVYHGDLDLSGQAYAAGKPDATGGKGGPQYMGGKQESAIAPSAGGKGAPGTGGQGEPGQGGKGSQGNGKPGQDGNNVKLGRLNLAKAWLSPGFDTTKIETSEVESPLVKLDLYTKVIDQGNILINDPQDITNPDGTITVVGYPDAFAEEMSVLSAYDLLVWCVGSVATTLPVTQATIKELNVLLNVTPSYDIEAFAQDVTNFVETSRETGE